MFDLRTYRGASKWFWIKHANIGYINIERGVHIGSNAEHENERLGKAGKKRGLGRKPHVRGVVMSPRDHPHGGGEAKSPVGRKKGPVDRWGNKAIGQPTRKNKRTDPFIVRRRKSGK